MFPGKVCMLANVNLLCIWMVQLWKLIILEDAYLLCPKIVCFYKSHGIVIKLNIVAVNLHALFREHKM